MLKNKKNNKDKTAKQKNQRILNIYSSHQTSLDAVCKGTSLPLKKNNRSSITNYNKPKDLNKKDKPKNHASTTKIKAPEVYERIPINISNSNTSSEIEFSNYGETVKQEPRPAKKHLSIDCDDQALIREIWQVGKKRKNLEYQAATKIQKVFRGYLTRKLLLKYAQQYEERLIEEKNKLRRKATYLQQNQDSSFYNSELKKSYFSSSKDFKQKTITSNSKEKPSIFEVESSIAINEYEHFQSIQDNEFLLKPEEQRKLSFVDPVSITLNQSSIAQQQETSLSFGQQAQPSPHFVPIKSSLRKKSRGEMMQSPNKMDKGVSTISEDKTRDGASQNISMSKQYNEKEEASNLSSIKKQELLAELYDANVEKLRSSQKAKWEQVIKLVHSNLKEHLNADRTKILMSTILEFSVKNREELNSFPQEQAKQAIFVTPTTITHRLQPQQHQIAQQKQFRDFKKKRWEEQNDESQIEQPKSDNRVLSRKTEQNESIFERTQKMKQYFLQNILVQDLRIDKMLQLRQNILRRRESNCLIELNNLLQNNMLTQDEFIQRLTKLSNTFRKQKTDIEQTKHEIYQGYKAQLQLFKSAALDAKYLGYYLPFSRSMQIFPNYPKWRFDDLMIDELNQLTSRRKQLQTSQKSIKKMPQQQHLEEFQSQEKEQPQGREEFFESEEEQSVSFTYEQSKIYKKCQPFSLDITDLASNEIMNSPKNMKHVSPFGRYSAVAVFQQLSNQDNFEQTNLLQIEGKQNNKQQKELQQKSQQKCLKRQRYQISQISSDEQQPEKANKKVDDLTDFYIKKLVWQTVGDLYQSSKLIPSLKLKRNKLAMEAVTVSQKTQFLQLCGGNLPDFRLVKNRVNQKMYPNSKQLLVSMREVDQEQQESQYLQIGQYQYILNQQICFTFIEGFLQRNSKNRKSLSKSADLCVDFKQEYQQFGSDKLKTKVFQRRIETSKLRESIQESREQILRIELHCLLDAWNQQLIKYRQNKLGYSGIGLNEISLSLIDRVCREVTNQKEYTQMMLQTKERLMNIVSMDNMSERLSDEYKDGVSGNDSQWILYTQQALEYGFDLAKIVELQLIFQSLDEIHSFFEPNKINFQRSESSEMASLDGEQEQLLDRKIKEMQQFGQSDEQDSFYK